MILSLTALALRIMSSRRVHWLACRRWSTSTSSRWLFLGNPVTSPYLFLARQAVSSLQLLMTVDSSSVKAKALFQVLLVAWERFYSTIPLSILKLQGFVLASQALSLLFSCSMSRRNRYRHCGLIQVCIYSSAELSMSEISVSLSEGALQTRYWNPF